MRNKKHHEITYGALAAGTLKMTHAYDEREAVKTHVGADGDKDCQGDGDTDGDDDCDQYGCDDVNGVVDGCG